MGFLLTYTIFITNIILKSYIGINIPFPLLAIQGILLPLEGFWNFLAYFRPRYNIISKNHKGKNAFQKFYLTIMSKPQRSSSQSTPRARGRRRRRNRMLNGSKSGSSKNQLLNKKKKPQTEKKQNNGEQIGANNETDPTKQVLTGTSLREEHVAEEIENSERKTLPSTHQYNRYQHLFSTEEDHEGVSIFDISEAESESIPENFPTFSSIFAEDILPQKERRRRSMIDFPSFPLYQLHHEDHALDTMEEGISNCGAEEQDQTSQDDTFTSISFSPSYKRQKRRSCPSLYSSSGMKSINEGEELL